MASFRLIVGLTLVVMYALVYFLVLHNTAYRLISEVFILQRFLPTFCRFSLHDKHFSGEKKFLINFFQKFINYANNSLDISYLL